jgi:hypothetical protein
MGEPVSSIELNFLKSIKVELPDEAFEFVMPKIEWNYFLFHFLIAKDIDHRLTFVPADDL